MKLSSKFFRTFLLGLTLAMTAVNFMAQEATLSDILISKDEEGGTMLVKYVPNFPTNLPVLKVRLKNNGGKSFPGLNTLWLAPTPSGLICDYNQRERALG